MKRKLQSESLLTTIEPQCCPEAVQLWADPRTGRGNPGETVKVRNHLAFLGWKFWYADKGGRMELRYESPTGKVFYSLRTACQACIDDDQEMLSESVGSNSADFFDEPEISNQGAKKRKVGGGKVVAGLKRLLRSETNQATTSRTLRPREMNLDDNNNINSNNNNGTTNARNPRTILSTLIDSKVVLPNSKVHYLQKRGSNSPPTTGVVTREGIICDCCSKVFGLTGFEDHAGSTNKRPSVYIVLDDGRSLRDCQNEAKRTNEPVKRKDNVTKGSDDDDKNDDICSMCHLGGVLVLCDKCPSSFHTRCLGLGDDAGDGDWFCPSCRCAICGDGKFEQGNGGGDENVLVCDQCERKCHIGCLRNAGVVKLGRDCQGNWFCSAKCEDINLGISKILGKPIVVGPKHLTWTLLKPFSSWKNSDVEDSKENRRKLKAALRVMHECFEPCKDPYTKRDIAEDVIFSRESQLSRLNFKRFYTVVLERDKQVITVGNVRIYSEVAEVPLVGTPFKHRKQGMCGIWMNELEKQLVKLGIERLTLPSVSTTLDIWTGSKFGFSKMTDPERLELLNYTFLIFKGTILCHKLLKQTGTPTDQSAMSTVTQEGQIQLENIAEGDELLSDVTDEMFLDLEDPSFMPWLND